MIDFKNKVVYNSYNVIIEQIFLEYVFNIFEECVILMIGIGVVI